MGSAVRPFNPTLVRLRRHCYKVALRRFVTFNPTLVRLRPAFAFSSAAFCWAPFNPTLVRLRHDIERQFLTDLLDFQSHLGSIAAGTWIRPPGVDLVLSIPPWFDCGSSVCHCCCSCCCLSIPPWFDCGGYTYILAGHYVRLSIPPWFDCGAPSWGVGDGGALDFQSHLGSIAAPCSCHAILCTDGFQSHLGSIAAIQGRVLRPEVDILSIPPWFDCGAFLAALNDALPILSIPPWFDCGWRGWCWKRRWMMLSIPPWFDCGRSGWDGSTGSCRLSIPPWFDCGLDAVTAIRAVLTAFNPTLVRLRLPQAQPGWTCLGLSIPPWFDCGKSIVGR